MNVEGNLNMTIAESLLKYYEIMREHSKEAPDMPFDIYLATHYIRKYDEQNNFIGYWRNENDSERT